MTGSHPARWQRVRAVFEDALERPPEERDAWLRTTCGDDDTLRCEVEELLRADASEDEGRLLDRGAVPDLLAVADPGRMVGAEVAGFRLLGVLGSGGMGTVFEAEQDRPRRRVALKTLRAGLATDRARRRFEFEVEVLGRLEHPNIARVLAAGTFEAGAGEPLPWFAMELVEDARTLDAFVQEEELSVDEILALILDVCDAVHTGHQQGVIHRDLKPANVLVDRAGRPRVIDFGIARAASDTEELQRSLQTATGQIVGTLRYMSPEQVEGEAVDIRTDVYALGVILYELLTGRAPHALDGLTLTAAAHRIREGAVIPPGDVVPQRRVPRDVDWVVLAAMEPDRKLRYASVSELAADLRRALADEPVDAGPPSTAYRVRKFVRRHRVAVASIGAILLAIVVGGIAALIGWREAENARGLADRRAVALAEESEVLAEVNGMLRGLLSGTHRHGRGRETSVLDLLQRARDDVEQRDLSDRPRVEVQLRAALGGSFFDIGEVEASIEILRPAVERGIVELGPEHPDTLTARHNLAAALQHEGRLDEARAELATVRDARIRLLGPGHLETVASSLLIGKLDFELGDYDRAEQAYRDALSVVRGVDGRHEHFAVRALNGLSTILQARGEHDEAFALLDEARAIVLESLEPRHETALTVRGNYALQLRFHGRFAEAEAEQREVTAAKEAVYGRTHPDTVGAWSNLAVIRQDQGDLAGAERALKDVLIRLEESGPTNAMNVLVARNNLAMIQERQDELGEAEAGFRALLEQLELPPFDRALDGHWFPGIVRKGLGVVLRKSGRLAEAEELLMAAYRQVEAVLGPDHARTGKVVEALVELHDAKGDVEAAADWRARLPATASDRSGSGR